MLPRSLAGRLLAAAVAGVLAAALMAGAVAWSWPRSPDARMATELDEAADKIVRAVAFDAEGRLQMRLPAKYADIYDAMPRDAAYLLRDASGRVLAHSAQGPALAALGSWQPDTPVVVLRGGTMPVRLQVAERRFERGGVSLQLRVGRSSRLADTLDDYAGKLYLRAGAVAVLLALLTFMAVVCFTVRRLMLPLHRASEVAARIGPRNLATRLHVAAMPTELVPLVDAFNAALDRLENGYRVQQEFLAAAAHELKTPLALLRAEIELEGAADPALLLRDTELMARQVHQLLHLAEVSEGHNYRFERLDLRSALAEAVDYMSRLAERQAVYLDVAPRDGAGPEVEADAAAVFVLAKNLLENALHHAPPGTVVRVDVHAGGFRVQDEGPGVAEADRPSLFQRFWRGRRDGQGAGLGLAICQEICLAHGWSIALAPAAPGQGACFEVALA